MCASSDELIDQLGSVSLYSVSDSLLLSFSFVVGMMVFLWGVLTWKFGRGGSGGGSPRMVGAGADRVEWLDHSTAAPSDMNHVDLSNRSSSRRGQEEKKGIRRSLSDIFMSVSSPFVGNNNFGKNNTVELNDAEMEKIVENTERNLLQLRRKLCAENCPQVSSTVGDRGATGATSSTSDEEDHPVLSFFEHQKRGASVVKPTNRSSSIPIFT